MSDKKETVKIKWRLDNGKHGLTYEEKHYVIKPEGVFCNEVLQETVPVGLAKLLQEDSALQFNLTVRSVNGSRVTIDENGEPYNLKQSKIAYITEGKAKVVTGGDTSELEAKLDALKVELKEAKTALKAANTANKKLTKKLVKAGLEEETTEEGSDSTEDTETSDEQ